ncbi:MAG: class I SAM-dependent methyltransferase, partial [Candidatus Dormibacteraeota bacterium]|nr:class I SAM-dependent methyltransferase [Candidatus Dormibacteraeota bacterium]
MLGGRPSARSFGAAAAEYERGRPGYPREAIDWLLPAGAQRVLDLGAGTGKLTRDLHARGLETVAVEPSRLMREEFRRALPAVVPIAGTAEDIPLADASVDAVLVAQAWHWVDVSRAVPEVARVLRPRGTLGLVWNLRDDRVDWVADLGPILHADDQQDLRSAAPAVGPLFGPVARADFAWQHQVTPAELVDLAASRSYVITRPAARRAALLRSVRELLTNHPALAGAMSISMPYIA